MTLLIDPDTLSSSLRELPSSTLRVAFCGASGTGKTTLSKWLNGLVGLSINPVGSRSTAKAMGFNSPYDVDTVGKRGDFQRRLQAEKVIWENMTANFVTDRTTLDEMVYTIMHDVKTVDRTYFTRAIDHLDRYTHIIFCPISAFIQVGDDPDRVKDATYHKIFDNLIRGFITEYAKDRVFELHGSDLEDRKVQLGSHLGLV